MGAHFTQVLKDWINQASFKDCFSAMHYAAYKGNIEVVQILIELGADIHCKNQYGLGVLHVSA